MGLLKLCSDDPIITILRDTFHANPIRVPEARIQPLIVLSRYKHSLRWVGELESLLTDGKPLSVKQENTMVADVSASKTKTVNVDLGIEIMGGFLQGMGINSVALNSQFKDVTQVSFVFRNVYRKWFDNGILGKQLIGRTFDKANPANSGFLYDDMECLLIDSIITSNNFTINVEQASTDNFELNVPALEQIAELKSKVQVDQQSKKSISFSNEIPLAFAFSCIGINFNQQGQLTFNTKTDHFYLNKTVTQEEIFVIPEHQQLSQDNMLFDIAY